MYSGTHGTDETLNKGVAVSFTVKLEVPAQVYILAIFTTILFPLQTPWGNHAKCCMGGKRIRCLQIVSRHVRIYLQQFPSYSNRKCKNRRFHVPQPTFLFPLEMPCDYHAIRCMDGKTIQCLPNPSQHVPYLSTFNSFQVIRCVNQ